MNTPALDTPAGAASFRRLLVRMRPAVTEKATDRHSVRLATAEGDDLGWCPCWSQYGTVRVGDVVEVAARGLTARGKLEMPRMVPTPPAI